MSFPASPVSYKGYLIRGEGRWPAVDRWFEAMELRDTYMGLRSDFYTHCHDLPPQLGGDLRADEGIRVEIRINPIPA
jgi:glutathione S-transferase